MVDVSVSGTVITQTFICSATRLYIRRYWYNGWNGWQRCDNYGTQSIEELVTAISGASDLSTLANALGVPMGIQYYHEKGTLTIPRGYGLLYTWNVSLGDFVLCAVGGGNVVTEVAKTGTNLTITKPTEYKTQISCSSSVYDVNAIFIGFA